MGSLCKNVTGETEESALCSEVSAAEIGSVWCSCQSGQHDQTARVPVEQRAVQSLGEAVCLTRGAGGSQELVEMLLCRAS